MVSRLLLNENKLLVSKAGFDAENPSLEQGDKLFDSDWLFSGTVVAAGLHVDNSPHGDNKYPGNLIPLAEGTYTASDQIINFTPLPFVPTVLLLPLSDSRYWQENGMVLLGADKTKANRPNDYYRPNPITVTNSRITIPRVYIRPSNAYYREDFIYLIMAM